MSTRLCVEHEDDDEGLDLTDQGGGTRRQSTSDINVEFLTSNLSEVNPFGHKKRFHDKSQAETQAPLILEICDNGESTYRNLTLRDLLTYVNAEAAMVDRRAMAQKVQHGTSADRPASSTFRPTSVGRRASINVLPAASSLGNATGTAMGQQSQPQQQSHLSLVRSAPNLVELGEQQEMEHQHQNEQDTLSPHGVSPTSQTSSITANHGAAFTSTVNLLRLRDLRRLEAQFSTEPTVLVRRHAVLFSLDPLRAVVMSKRLILIVPEGGSDDALQVLVRFMEEWAANNNSSSSNGVNYGSTASLESSSSNGSNSNLAGMDSSKGQGHGGGTRGRQDPGPGTEEIRLSSSFEQHAYDALFTMVNSLQMQEVSMLQNRVHSILRILGRKNRLLSFEVQERLRALKNDLAEKAAKVSSFRRAMTELIEDDEGMALMNLTRLRVDPLLYKYPLSPEILGTHEEIEELLEAYLMDYNANENKLKALRSQMQSAEELVLLRLDTSRNELLVVNTCFAILACAIALGAYITGVFGMNLDQTMYLQPVNGMFAIIFSMSGLVIILVFTGTVFFYTYNGVLPNLMFIGAKEQDFH